MSAQRQHGPDSPLLGVDLEAVDAALERLDPGLDGLLVIERLRTLLPVDEARFAAELHELRQRARGRFPAPERAFLTRKGLAQATRLDVANARARRFRAVSEARFVLDATCGLGADALALAGAGVRVVAMDRDAGVARLARANLERAGHAGHVIVGDATKPPARTEWLVADPDRRAGGERSLDPERWSPPLTRLLAMAREARGACLKLPPSFAGELLHDAPVTTRLQWVSSAGELCEVALWTGELAEGGGPRREVLVLPRGGGEVRLCAEPEEVAPLPDGDLEGAGFLADPDPALVRSGLLGVAARRASMAPLGPRCAYLVGPAPSGSALLPSWRVLGVTRADARAVRRLCAQHDVGPLTVRKRGHPDPAEVLARRFRGPGTQRGHLAVARLERGHAVFLLELEATI